MIYLDNASTYHPKSPRIASAVSEYLLNIVSSPGRGGHRQGRKAADLIGQTQELARELFNAEECERFHFCSNATHGLNFVIQGLLEPGDHVVTTALEHNSVLRPLKKLSVEKRIEVTIVPCDSTGVIDPYEIIRAVRPETKLMILNHASNVVGTVLPLKPIIEFCRSNNVKTLVDASQSAGLIPIDLKEIPLDFLVATGHKALRGPSGTGILYARSTEALKPLLVGGTGGNSLSLWHPQNAQAIFESGTPNYLGIAGLKAALEDVLANPTHLGAELRIAKHLVDRLQALEGVRVHGPSSWENRVPIVSFTVDRVSPQMALGILDDEYEIIVRAGLHCAPIVHQMIGTAPEGTIRASLSHVTTFSEVHRLIEAVADMAHAGLETRSKPKHQRVST